VPFVISSASSFTSIAVFWIGSANASQYVVERQHASGAWTPVATNSLFEAYFTDVGLMPGTAYSYRIKAVNAGGSAPYSPTTTSYTWGQVEQWAYDNFGDPEAMNGDALRLPAPEGTLPLLRYAFNLTANEPERYLQPGQSSGYPAIWLDGGRNRLCVEFVRRKASMNPGISYEVQFCDSLSIWTATGTMVTNTSIDEIWERVRYEDPVNADQVTARFSRVIVVPQ
jgi:hypothetical protein